MRPTRWPHPLLFSLAFVCTLAAEPAIPPGEFIGRAWAGEPVSFALVVERGHQFIAYYDADRRLTVVGRPLNEKNWTRIQPTGVAVSSEHRFSNITGWDSHNYLRLALDRDGRVHLSGNMHSDPLVYYRSQEPFDLTTLARIDRMTGEREDHCTYPVFFKDAAGDLLFRYRDGRSGNGSDLYNIYDTRTRVWRRQLDRPLLDGQGRRNAYALDPVLGPDGRFHLVWMWRDTPDCATNHTLSYARSRDFVHWETSTGQPLTLPITLATGEVIDPAAPHEGLINMTFNLGFDEAQRPIVVYHRYDSQHRSQAYVARPPAAAAAPNAGSRDGWEIRQLSSWNFRWAFGGMGSIEAEVTLGPPRVEGNDLLVDYFTQAAGRGRWRLRGDTLQLMAALPAAPPALPAELQKPGAGLEVQTVVVHDHGLRWVLRWETLPRNRDEPRVTAPPPSALRLYQFPDTDIAADGRIGS